MRRLRRTLYDLCCPYFLPEVMVNFTRKATGHFVTLTESGMYLIECIAGHNSRGVGTKLKFNVSYLHIRS